MPRIIPGTLLLLMLLPGCASIDPLRQQPLGYEARVEEQQRREDAVARYDEERRRSYTFDDRMREGDRRYAGGERAQALRQYIEAHRLEPKNPVALNRIGYFYVTEDAERAAAIFAQVLRDDASNPEAHAGMGFARLSQGRLDEAEEAFAAALEVDPTFADALDALGVVKALQDRPSEARRHAHDAFRSDPNDAEIANNLGVAYLADGEFAQAERSFRTAILLNPDDPALYNNLGIALGRQGRYDESLEAFRRFNSIEVAHNNLGYLHHLNGDYDGAIRHYKRALELGTEHRREVLRNLNSAARAATARDAHTRSQAEVSQSHLP